MKRYKVTLRSKDNNTFEYTCSAKDINDAKSKALQNIKDKGWDMYSYKVIYVEKNYS